MGLQRAAAILVLLFLPCPLFAASATPDSAALRTPQYPLKTARGIYTDADVLAARENVKRYGQARAIAERIVQRATRWLERADAELVERITSAGVPRAFNVGTAGCPKCGKAIYEKGGTYPWKLDLKWQFQVECPICGGRFPDNDYAAYYASGFKQKRFLAGDYADDGWGWVGPDGERYWFVAYANHWNWRNSVLPAIRDLARAYLLTGERRFAHKAAVMLARVAQVYPAMDYHRQSRYGQLQAARGTRYEGKTLNHIWETGVLHMLAESYDAVWDTIDGDQALQDRFGRNGAEMRGLIEANLLEEGIEAVLAKKISGNYGMHQKALVFAVLARGGGPVDAWLDGVLHGTDRNIRHLGLVYALYNLVFRDGVPYETSPGYNFSWVRNLTEVAETLAKANRDVYANPKMRLLYSGVLDVVNIGTQTPALGDSGSVYGGFVGRDPFTFQAAYRAYGDERLSRHLAQFGATGAAGYSTYESLYRPIVQTPPAAARQPLPSRLLDGYGMGILNNRSDTVSLALYYGTRGGHGHFDRLHFDIFADGLPLTPDLGYPDFMNAYVPGIYTWSKNTVSHNTVTVDAARQRGNAAGTVHLFADAPFARVIDVGGPGTYPVCQTYRRRVVMIDVDEERSYFVDVFTVQGGRQHDYSLHGPPGAFRAVGGSWSAAAAGTLAGTDVAVGQIYDNAAMAAAGYKGSYAGYQGSGFQHLLNVQRHLDGSWFAEWSHARDPAAKIRLRVLDQPDQEIILADAQVSPVKQKEFIKYVIARRQGKELKSQFVSLLEPFSGAPAIRLARIESSAGGTKHLVVERDGGWQDLVSLDNPAADAGAGRADVPSVTVKTLAPDGKVTRIFAAGPAAATFGAARLHGTVIGVEPPKRTVRVRLDSAPKPATAAALVGHVVHFRNSLRQTAHTIVAATCSGAELTLETRDALLVGRAHLTMVSSTTLTTDALFQFATVYRGAYLADKRCTQYHRIDQAQTDSVTLAQPLAEPHPFAVGQDAWVVDVGPADELVVPALFVAEEGT